MKKGKLGGVILIMLTFFACRKPFSPDVISSTNSYLIVEGVINSANDSTIIHLSKTVQISGNTKANVLNGCIVTVESEQGTSLSLQGTGNGKYVSPALNIDATKKYRLHIITPDSKEYASDYVPVKQTPAIGDITYDTPNANNALQLYVNTQDATNNTRYYRWDFTETWKFNSKYQSLYIVDGKAIRARTPNEQAYLCYANDTSQLIYIGSSAKLSQDVISQLPLANVGTGSEKLSIRYSILVRQYALSKEEYQFWDNLKKNTEELGSIFDAQPSQIDGNIHNVKDVAEPVIGFVSVTNVQTKRIFINNGDPKVKNGITNYPYGCTADTALYQQLVVPVKDTPQYYDKVAQVFFGSVQSSTPIRILDGALGAVLGYTFSSAGCVDCRIRGKNVAPPFWVD